MKEGKYYKTYVFSVTLTVALCVSGIFLGIALRTRHLVHEEMLSQARAYFDQIVLTRKWNAMYGGVFVEKKEGVTSNPYIDHPDIRTADGRTFTIRNPALMTREISELAEEEAKFQFRITSLRPLNPANAPDTFEEDSLRQFEAGIPEAVRHEVRGGRTFFRYMAPLYVGKECLPCHARQGYKEGEVRGGISVTFDIGNVQGELKENFILIAVLGAVTVMLLLGVLYLLTKQLFRKLREAREKIETLAITDELTGIFNRRHLMNRFGEEFQRAKRLRKGLGAILIDIDHFKSVNDRYGHLVGDTVLKKVAAFIGESIRGYDILGRLGGEEFLVVLPDAAFEETRIFAERIRRTVRERFQSEDEFRTMVAVTVSLGVTVRQDSDESIDDILRRADEGLYRAKQTGRDRVAWV